MCHGYVMAWQVWEWLAHIFQPRQMQGPQGDQQKEDLSNNLLHSHKGVIGAHDVRVAK